MIEAKAKELAMIEAQEMRNEMAKISTKSWRYKDLQVATDWLSDFCQGVKKPAPNLLAKLAAHRIAQGV